jgi:hypothetical protein
MDATSRLAYDIIEVHWPWKSLGEQAMSANVNEIIRELSPAERKKIEDRAAKLIAEEMGSRPAVLRAIGEESRRKGTASLSSRQIDRIIKAVRAQEKIGRKRRAKD